MLKHRLMSSVVSPIKALRNQFMGGYIVRRWQQNGKPYPVPHIVKQTVINQCRKQYGLTTLVETGTYLGDMVDVQKAYFDQVISIELSEELARLAQKRFGRNANVDIRQGDSATVLKQVTRLLRTPALFWLDGHYSGGITAKGDTECPIFSELEAVFSNNQDHIILIDDARCFIGKGDYPSLEELSKFITQRDIRYRISVEHDIIRVVC